MCGCVGGSAVDGEGGITPEPPLLGFVGVAVRALGVWKETLDIAPCSSAVAGDIGTSALHAAEDMSAVPPGVYSPERSRFASDIGDSDAAESIAPACGPLADAGGDTVSACFAARPARRTIGAAA